MVLCDGEIQTNCVEKCQFKSKVREIEIRFISFRLNFALPEFDPRKMSGIKLTIIFLNE
ncbi:hypothetical protein MTR_5g029915 [Medicago truncatula]|uniref:Uncharacterized protein n=1 Tax=Medicago truncatula TaxID=3880 RepID=A0A072UPC9_MEDTR|nr:hypothetical protein MTR_5g029915 [Medicago truncatula]